MANQDGPLQEGAGDATFDERVRGLVQQMRADFLVGSVSDAPGVLRKRLADTGIELNEQEFERAVKAITG